MIMRVPSSSASRPQTTSTGNSPAQQDLPSGSGVDPKVAQRNQIRDALNSYIKSTAINDMQKKESKLKQAHQKNVAKQKEKKAEAEQDEQSS